MHHSSTTKTIGLYSEKTENTQGEHTMGFNRIEVYKDMGQYVLYKSVEVRNGQLFVRMKKVSRSEAEEI